MAREALTAAYEAQDLAKADQISKVFGVRFTQDEIQAIYDQMEYDLCYAFLTRSIKREERLALNEFNEMNRKLTNYLENDCAFRDYDIYHRKAFGDAETPIASKVAVHQCVDSDSMERDVQNAL